MIAEGYGNRRVLLRRGPENLGEYKEAFFGLYPMNDNNEFICRNCGMSKNDGRSSTETPTRTAMAMCLPGRMGTAMIRITLVGSLHS